MADLSQDFVEKSAPPHDAGDVGALLVKLDGFEGPIDLLLSLARDQKVDLTQISILHLANQYLAFIAEARRLRLELAADYLVMAAWLAYLKSRLLIPAAPMEGDDEPTGEELAALLAFQLRRLEAMRAAGQKLMSLPQLGRDVYRRGLPEGVGTILRPLYHASLFDLLTAYGDQHRRQCHNEYKPLELDLYSVEDALKRLRAILGDLPIWASLQALMPTLIGDAQTGEGLRHRSALASTLLATLELVREGEAQIRQDGTFGPIYVRRRPQIADDAVKHG